jgi:hypothetical protein
MTFANPIPSCLEKSERSATNRATGVNSPMAFIAPIITEVKVGPTFSAHMGRGLGG